jgi:hypothetical protein
MTTLNDETFYRLANLLPRLSALTDRRRLEVLSDIDRVLAAENLSWTDITECLMPPSSMLQSATVVQMCETIAQALQLAPLTENATEFLTELLRQAKLEPAVHLTPRQYQWLRSLYERAEKKLRVVTQPPAPVAEASNVVTLRLV